jgi:hypothetical protein
MCSGWLHASEDQSTRLVRRGREKEHRKKFWLCSPCSPRPASPRRARRTSHERVTGIDLIIYQPPSKSHSIWVVCLRGRRGGRATRSSDPHRYAIRARPRGPVPYVAAKLEAVGAGIRFRTPPTASSAGAQKISPGEGLSRATARPRLQGQEFRVNSSSRAGSSSTYNTEYRPPGRSRASLPTRPPQSPVLY